MDGGAGRTGGAGAGRTVGADGAGAGRTTGVLGLGAAGEMMTVGGFGGSGSGSGGGGGGGGKNPEMMFKIEFLSTVGLAALILSIAILSTSQSASAAKVS